MMAVRFYSNKGKIIMLQLGTQGYIPLTDNFTGLCVHSDCDNLKAVWAEVLR